MEDAGMERGGRIQQVVKQEEKTLTAFYVSTLQTFENSGYFDASFKRRYPTQEKPTKIVALADHRRIEIVPTQKYGYPNAVDLDYKRALFRIIDEQAEWVERIRPDGTKTKHPKVDLPIRAQTKPWIRYAGRYPHPTERKNLNDFLHRSSATRLIGEFEDPKTKQFRRADVALFSQVITRGEKTKEGIESEYHLLWLTDFAIREYYWLRTRKEDINFHNLLTCPISKVILPYLDSGWFAVYSNGGSSYTKSYAALCNFLSITCYKQKSRLKEQLDPAHEELKALGYLERWEYRPRGNGDWIITWFPGWKWFEDAKARGYAITPRLEAPKPEPEQPELPLVTQEDPATREAKELVQLFYQTFHNTKQAKPSEKEMAHAAALIEQYGLEIARHVVGYSYRVASDSSYKPVTFGGIVSFAAHAVADYDQAKANEARKQAIAACSSCDGYGMVEATDERGHLVMRYCTHQPLQAGPPLHTA